MNSVRSWAVLSATLLANFAQIELAQADASVEVDGLHG